MSKSDKRENIILIASEPLTFEQADWMEIPTNTLIVITPKMNLLQVPIVDEFFVADPIKAKERGSDFAAQKGLLSSNYGGRRGGAVPTPLQPPTPMAAEQLLEHESRSDLSPVPA